MKHSRRAPPATLAAIATVLAAGAAADAPLPRTELRAGEHRFDVEIAATPSQHAQGLMGRTELADNAGMLFVFKNRGRHCFWMKDTPLPLSVAFLADDGSVVGIEDMQPMTTDSHCAPVPVRYALELRAGALPSRGIGRGARFAGEPLGTSPKGQIER
ncbi:MAG TPA: DUF192 domain-containing protein [Thiobacillaceae bacterium]|nr:DUF192 domain-containing protein [Thiobacillaceae bacterium]